MSNFNPTEWSTNVSVEVLLIFLSENRDERMKALLRWRSSSLLYKLNQRSLQQISGMWKRSVTLHHPWPAGFQPLLNSFMNNLYWCGSQESPANNSIPVSATPAQNSELNYSCVSVCLRAFLFLLHTEYQNTHSFCKLRTFLGREDIWSGPHNLKGLFPGKEVV